MQKKHSPAIMILEEGEGLFFSAKDRQAFCHFLCQCTNFPHPLSLGGCHLSMWIEEGFGWVAVLSFSSAYGRMSCCHVDIKIQVLGLWRLTTCSVFSPKPRNKQELIIVVFSSFCVYNQGISSLFLKATQSFRRIFALFCPEFLGICWRIWDGPVWHISRTSMVIKTGLFPPATTSSGSLVPSFNSLAFAPICLECSVLITLNCAHQIDPSTWNAPVPALTCLLNS